MSKKQLKIAFIGGGLNSAIGYTHKIASQMDNRFKLVAGSFSRDPKINKETAKQWDISENRLYDNWNDLLKKEQEKIDAIVVLTPTPTHYKIIKKAIQYGYNVISEKSLTTSLKNITEINKLVKTHNAFLAVVYNYTGYPMLRELKRMIENHELGKLNQIHIEMPQEGYLKLNNENKPNIPQDWRLTTSDIPIISLDLGVHLENIIKFLSNETPIELVAIKDSFGNFKNITDNIMCIAKYSNNLSCQIWYSKSALGKSNGLKLRVYGSKASVEWEQTKSEYLIYNNQYGVNKIISRGSNEALEAQKPRYNRFKPGHPSGFIEAFANYYYDIADTLINFQKTRKFISKNVFNNEDSKNGILMFKKIEESAKNKSWETFK